MPSGSTSIAQWLLLLLPLDLVMCADLAHTALLISLRTGDVAAHAMPLAIALPWRPHMCAVSRRLTLLPKLRTSTRRLLKACFCTPALRKALRATQSCSRARLYEQQARLMSFAFQMTQGAAALARVRASQSWRFEMSVMSPSAMVCAPSVPPLWLTHALGKPRGWLTVGALSLATSGLPQGTSDGLCTRPAHKPPANTTRPNGYKARAGWAALGHRCPTSSHRAWLAVSHHLHDPTQASNPQHVQTRLHRHPIYVLASRMTNTDVCISQGVHIVVACVHCTKGESNRTTTMLSCTLCICPHRNKHLHAIHR